MTNNTTTVETTNNPHLAILPSPGMGHVVPLAELAKRLAAAHGFSSTFITYASSNSKAQRQYLAALPPCISSVSLPPVDLSDLPADAAIETLLSVEAARSVPSLTAILENLKNTTNLVAFIPDLFGADGFDASRAVGVPGYLFFPSNLLMLSVVLHLPDLDKKFSCEFRELPDPVMLPGCVPIPGSEILQPLQDRTNDAYKWMVHHGKRYCDAAGILVNTFDAVEPEAAAVLRASENGRPPVYPVGPLIRNEPGDDVDMGCINWLDKQPSGSVLYVSFGSGGALPVAQMAELALGLELTGQRFLWVVRAPVDSGADPGTNYYDSESKRDPLGFLPGGFVDRTRGVGLLVPSWAPQISVLQHRSIGGILTHCGWNSVLESIAHGVPMIAWPLYAEQRENAVMLCQSTGVALRPEQSSRKDGLVVKEEIADVVTKLMTGEEGKQVRAKVEELREAAELAVKEGGTSYETLEDVVVKWKRVRTENISQME